MTINGSLVSIEAMNRNFTGIPSKINITTICSSCHGKTVDIYKESIHWNGLINGRENHHITGAEIAGKKLKELNYPQEKIELVKKCILSHRGSQESDRETIEEKIIADADAMSNFDNIAGIFKAAFVYEKLEQGEAIKSVRRKLQNKWNKLHFEDSKNIIKPKYEAVMLLLK